MDLVWSSRASSSANPLQLPLEEKGGEQELCGHRTLRFAYDALRGESVAAGGLCVITSASAALF
ncbi:hypothetical protein [Marinomonas pollencensis]|uniref:hypothetical protein n=1 Tax=Marinomonas pollencensis TaxID=491954 RepID=UPI000E21FA78|nr:hypothetical protein [Marinomonas pollencensis]